MTHDAIVVGGGPAGAVTALRLAEAGWSVAVVEKSRFPRRKVCGDFMSATNAALLDRIGLASTWRARGGPEVRRVGLFSGETVLSAPMPRAREGTFGRALGRDVLDALLLDAAESAGAEILLPWSAVRHDDAGGSHSLVITSKERERVLRAPVLVAAHGSWETGSLPTQPQKSTGPSDLFGFKAYFEDARLPHDLMPLLAFPGGYGGLVHADAGRLSLSCCIRRDVLDRLRREHRGCTAGEAVGRHIRASCRGAREALHGARLNRAWLGVGPVRPGIRVRYRDDIFRAGNAAGEAHPVVAEGISMAVQSAWLLASALSDIDPHDPAARATAGSRYDRAWRAQFAGRIRAAGMFARLAMQPTLARVVEPLIRAAPGLLTLGAGLSGKARPMPG